MKKFYSVSVLVAVMILLSSALQAFASYPYPEGSYYSLYQTTRTYTYKDLSGATQTQERVGYRYENALTDSIVVCGVEGNTACITATYGTQTILTAYYSGQISAFKVFVPPGTSQVSLSSHVGQSSGAKYLVVARLGSPPQVDISQYISSSTAFNSLPIDGFTLSQLRSGDCIGRNTAGYLNIANDGGLNIRSESDGGWIYAAVIIISGNVIDNVYSNLINVGSPTTAGTYLGWYANKTDWDSTMDLSYIGGNPPTNVPTPTPTVRATPTPTPTTLPTSGCDMYNCPSGNCVNGVCVTTRPTPTPTAATGCDSSCLLCLGGSCLIPGTNPKPTPTLTPTPTVTPAVISFDAQPISEMTLQTISCKKVSSLTSFTPVLKTSSPPSGTVAYYSALMYAGENPFMCLAQRDITDYHAFILYVNGNPLMPDYSDVFPQDGSWTDPAFASLFSKLSGITCSSLVSNNISFLYGFAPNGDLTKFEGAWFTFSN